MTRESALKLIPLREKNCGIVGQGVINKIYDDFESRTCEHCKTQNETENCPIYYEAYNLHFAKNETDFGCNKFESKEK